jgi:putative flippase GtrA
MTTVNLIDKIPQGFKFMLVGAFAALVHFLVVILLVEFFFLNPLFANFFAFLIAFCVSFTGQRLFTFANSNKTIRQSLLPYFVISLTSFVCNELLLSLAIYLLHLPYQLALILVLLVVAIGTFFSSKYWAFAKS